MIRKQTAEHFFKLCCAVIGIAFCCCGLRAQPVALKTSDYKHYIDSFNANDNELYKGHYANNMAWSFLQDKIPLFDCPDKQMETTYYFRWWTFRKHLKKTPDGFVITEFLPDVDWAGKYNTINCAAGHHIYEGRWLADTAIIKDYINFWFKGGGGLRSYSTWLADALFQYSLVKGDFLFAKSLQPHLIKNFKAWQASNGTSQGLYWSNDDRDGMEMSVSGKGLRPTLNSYMYADAMAISKIALMSGDETTASLYSDKARHIKQAIQNKLWDSIAGFFKVIPLKDKDSQMKDQSFKMYGNKNVREILGYTPWYVNMADASYAAAWLQLKDTSGFNAPYGLTTTEQRSPSFGISYKDHECQWNGPSWPFATSVTLTALANLLHNQAQPYISRNYYFKLLQEYSRSHTLQKEDGKNVPWIDENLNPYTGDWISRTRLKTWKNGTWDAAKGGEERGKDYNHSTFCDLIISGLVGIQPQADNRLIIDPLVTAGGWSYFCLDNVRYHNKTVTVLYDKTGKKYNKGKGLMVFVDGKKRASTKNIQKITLTLDK